jgi:hypothetical protein
VTAEHIVVRRVGEGLPPPETARWETRAVLRVSRFETSGSPFKVVNANTDQQGLSWGPLHFTQKSGNLGKALSALRAHDQVVFDDITKGYGAELVRSTTDPSVTVRMAAVGGRVLWDPWWVQVFQALGDYPPFQTALLLFAATGEHMEAARRIARSLGRRAWSERAMTVIFDRVVQTWSRAFDAAKTLTARYPGDLINSVSEWSLLDQFIDTIAESYGHGSDTWKDVRVRRGSALLTDPELRDSPVYNLSANS